MKDIKRAGKDALSVATLGASNYVDKTLNPDIPTIEEPDAAPVADDQAISLANKRKAAKRRQGGRAGTILTEGSKLG
ncbi:hypothetical protein OAO65_02310 [Flavobacteriales bacterium]|nr:hypothetical protein [Flavobacteriales bacterium]